jgi:hypothetical protein
MGLSVTGSGFLFAGSKSDACKKLLDSQSSDAGQKPPTLTLSPTDVSNKTLERACLKSYAADFQEGGRPSSKQIRTASGKIWITSRNSSSLKDRKHSCRQARIQIIRERLTYWLDGIGTRYCYGVTFSIFVASLTNRNSEKS